MVNVSVLNARLEKLREYLNILRSIREYDLERFRRDPLVYGAAERYLHLSIECLIDIGNHVISDRGYRKPQNYADVFMVLNEEDIISDELLEKIEGMAAFRNILVHDYLRLDRDRVYTLFSEKIPVMEELASVFSKML